MIQRSGNGDLFIDLNRKTKYLWHRLTKTDLMGVGAVDSESLRRHMTAKGFDFSRAITKSSDIDSVYYKQERHAEV